MLKGRFPRGDIVGTKNRMKKFGDLTKSIPLLSARVLAPIEAVKVKSNTLVSLVTIKVVLESERITAK